MEKKKSQILSCNKNWVVTEISKRFFFSDAIYGMTSDNQGNIYVTNASTYGCKINTKQKNDFQQFVLGTSFRDIGTNLRGLVWNNDKLIVCNYSLGAFSPNLLVFDLKTRKLSFIDLSKGTQENQLHYPQDIYADKNGALYITDKNRLCCLGIPWHPNGSELKTVAGQLDRSHIGGNGPADTVNGFYEPGGIARSSDGTFYVADRHNHCIRQVKNGVISTFAGTLKRSGNKDGLLHECLFHQPYSLCLLDESTLLVTECFGSLRVIDLRQQVVRTIIQNNVDNGSTCCVHKDCHGSVFFACAKGLYKLERVWSWQRWLWLGFLKEDPTYCGLARLPKDVVKYIQAEIVC